MSAVAEKRLLTPDDLLALPGGKSYELIDGKLQERQVGNLSNYLGGKVFAAINAHAETNRLGLAFANETGFQCFPDRPRTVRKPDVAFVRAGRMSEADITQDWYRVAPDLVVEVVSPSDKFQDVDKKVDMFRRADVPLIWVVNPPVRTIRVIRGDGSTATLREGDELSGEGVLSGFSCPLASIFPPKGPAPEVAPTP